MTRSGALAVALLAVACTKGGGPEATVGAVKTSTIGYELRVSKIVHRVSPAVVTLHVQDRNGESHATGAGFIVGADGLIATSFHVIGEARPIEVELADGRRADVLSIHAFDRVRDVALLRIDAEGLPTVEIGDPSTLSQGDPLIALGNPLGLKQSIATGFVAAVREIEGRPMIQLTMPIEPGNSGGPVIDLEGRVHGIVTMKSMVTTNLGFAVSIDTVRQLHLHPNPVPMDRWLTIGALDPLKWSTLFGARWRQRSGRIVVDRPGRSMAGRSLCLLNDRPPKMPYVVSADVKLDDDDGAAGIAFASDGGYVHYGFYPTRNRLRVTRFEGEDVFTWRILFDDVHPAYRPGEWNHFEIRHDVSKLTFWVNDQRVAELKESKLSPGRIGFVKFRNTSAQMKRLEVHSAQRPRHISEAEALERKARDLEWRATQLRRKAVASHERVTRQAIVDALESRPPNLLRAVLLIAKLDNRDVDVDAYVEEVNRMGKELGAAIPSNATTPARVAALDNYLFYENGFHGGRDDYHERANSYLSSVIDDREGLPITLSVLYMELGHRIGLPVVGAALPGHFVVRLGDVLIDPFDGGAQASVATATALMRNETGRPIAPEDLAPAPPRAIVLRVLANLIRTATREDDATSQLRYLDTILVIAPDAATDRQRRAHLRVRAGLAKDAVADFEKLLDDAPPGIDLEEVARWRDLLVDQQR